MIQHSEGTFEGAGKLPLYYQSWHPENPVRAVLAILHGLGGHSGLFNNLVQHFIPLGYAVYGLDLRGHGRSSGQRGHIHSWAEFREDLDIFLRLIKEQEPNCPRFLLGHSLGAAIALDYVLRFPEDLQGVIALAPALGKVGVSPIRLFLGQILSRIWPRFTLDTGIDLAAGSRDQAVLAAYEQDLLRHTRGSARLATEFFATVAWISAHTLDLKVPLLLLHGEGDRVTPSEESRLFFEKVIFPDKELHEYPGVYHEIHNDLNYEEMLSDLEDWLERHLEVVSKAS